jgi:glycosyltransferase involved in cell wall biosynthesis
VSDRFQRLVFSILPGKKAMGRALVAILERIKDEKILKATLECLPRVIASHSAIVSLRNARFVKETSSGRDLVISCGNTVHEWNPELLKTKGKGFIGGAEEAVINLSRELAKLGWNVTVYNNCGNKPIRDLVTYCDHNGATAHKIVTYRPFWERNFGDKQDVVILWRFPRPLDTPINAPKIFVDLHDSVLPADEFTPARLRRLTKILVKSKFHRSLFPNIPDDKIAVIPNGIDLSLLESDPPIKKDPYLIINTSSADRSMDVLPKLFKEVKRRVPQARLQWAYGWDVYKADRHKGKEEAKTKYGWMKQTQKEMDEAGIETLGRLTQAEVGKLYQRASILAYPTECLEIDCISVRKAQAAGCLPVVTDFGALAESAPFGWKVHSTKTKDTWNRPGQIHFGLEGNDSQQQWVDLCVKALQLGVAGDDAAMREWSRQFEWNRIAARWNEILTA